MTSPPKRIILGITGASGSPYGRALLDALTQTDFEIHLVVSRSAVTVLREEIGLEFPDQQFDVEHYLGRQIDSGRIFQYDDRDLAAAPASGSFRSAGMIICPCSMKTLGTIAHGTGASLVSRAADAILKERRRLVLVPRETPLSLVHLRNMVSVTEAGAIVLPAMPGFYMQPQTIDDLIQHLVLKILDAANIEHSIPLRWKDK